MLAEDVEDPQEPEHTPPGWTAWSPPVLKEPLIHANANVALLQPAHASRFAYWRRGCTRERGQPVFLPVQLASSQRQALAGKTLDRGTTLARKPEGWWLTLP